MVRAGVIAGLLVLGLFASVDGRLNDRTQSKDKVTPVEKVISLIKDLMAQTTETGKSEAKAYDDFSCFCKEQADEKLYNIERSTAKLEKLAAKIAELEGEIAQLNSDIADLSKQMTSLEEEIESISDERATQHSDYLVEAKDMSDAIDAMERALAALDDAKKGQVGDSKTLLLELKAVAASVLDKTVKNANMTPSDKDLSILTMLREYAGGPGEAHGYEMKSAKIIQTLKDLKKTFKENKVELDDAEFAAKAAFEKKKLGLQNEHKFAGMEKDEKAALEESKSEELAATQEDESEETAAKTADNNFMKVLTDQCEDRAKQFDQRSKTRADELQALSDALGALESGVQPNYSANSKLTLAQVNTMPVAKGHWVYVEDKAPSFLQVHESSSKMSERVVALLEKAADKFKSPLLATLSLKVKVHLAEDHFVKVRQMIKDLIAKLKADAEAEAESKSYCDKNMMEAVTNRDEAKMTIEEKTADISKNEAEKADLTADIAALNKEIAEAMKSLNEATELRSKDKAENEKTVSEAEAGKEAVTFALSTLKEFYEGAAFVQQARYTPPNVDRSGKTFGDLAPAGPSGEYKGNQENAKGILGLLEVILSDFERTIKTTTDTEEDEQAKFDAYEKETKDDVEAMEDDIAEKTGRIADIDDTLMTLENEKKDAEDMLAGALASLEKLKPMCVDGTETYEQRVKAREEEIAALKEAMQILIDWQGL